MGRHCHLINCQFSGRGARNGTGCAAVSICIYGRGLQHRHDQIDALQCHSCSCRLHANIGTRCAICSSALICLYCKIPGNGDAAFLVFLSNTGIVDLNRSARNLADKGRGCLTLNAKVRSYSARFCDSRLLGNSPYRHVREREFSAAAIAAGIHFTNDCCRNAVCGVDTAALKSACKCKAAALQLLIQCIGITVCRLFIPASSNICYVSALRLCQQHCRRGNSPCIRRTCFSGHNCSCIRDHQIRNLQTFRCLIDERCLLLSLETKCCQYMIVAFKGLN